MPDFWNSLYDPAWLGAWASVATAIFTLFLALIAMRQLGVIAAQYRKSATLDACNRYDAEALLADYREKIERFIEKPDEYPLDHIDIEIAWTAIFNYFDAIAIGLKQRLYDNEIAREHIGTILRDWISDLVGAKDAASVQFRENFRANFPRTSELCRLWGISIDGLK